MKRYYTNALDSRVFEHADGPFVLFAEHEAAVAVAHKAGFERAWEIAGNTKLEARIAHLESALTLLTNGYKYSTEVVTIAREALEQK